MKLPSFIAVGAKRYLVKLTDNPYIIRQGKRVNCGAVIYYDSPCIMIKKGSGYDRQAESLTHEMLHAWLSHCDYETRSCNEKLVGRLSRAILDTMFNTPRLLEYLISVRDARNKNT